MLHRIPTPASVRASFAEVTTKQVADWVTTHVGRTLTSQRRAAYAEHRKAVKGATCILVLTSATPAAVAISLFAVKGATCILVLT